MRKKGFTLVELLVVIAIIALLMSILMPALSKVRQLANRVVCGTNLKGIGSAMMLYAGDMDNKYPRAGGDESQWGTDTPSTEDGADIQAAYGNEDPDVPITASFYLLVKYDYTSTEQFLCKSDTGVKEFDATNKELYWDFYAPTATDNEFDNPAECVSYSLQLPYRNDDNRSYYLSPSKSPGLAVAADRNPFIKNQACSLSEGYRVIGSSDQDFEWDPDNETTREKQMNGNSPVHQQEGQNVLFNDGHVSFENRSFCGVENDNIYTYWPNNDPTEKEQQEGVFDEHNGADSSASPMNQEDTLLVNDNYDSSF
jgi:prepilin-type N-terminal cleavage/methylation domain-containing protein/prepilin-type processing-associated H-X9-DG protein